MFGIDRLRVALRHSEGSPGLAAAPAAAVAAVLRDDGPDSAQLLLIERATRAGDPWSGQIALPGGRRERGDRDAADTAERETLEELALDLAGAERLGRLADQSPSQAVGVPTVSALVYWIGDAEPTLRPNQEVRDALWVPLRELVLPERYRDYRYPALPERRFPAVALDSRERVVWGLTLRFLEDLFQRLDHRFPVRPGPRAGW
ncbi:MAG TPA: CoA pyrophosphatase [Thermoanaerobaculia bacterium]|nr:CoA pyrophosphatase [Thermoanaerobaculia bacterium]